MADEQWYYVQAGQRLGPVAIETLQALLSAGSVHGGDLVWTEGMADWVAASTVRALATVPNPPPVTGQPQYVQPQYGQPQYGQPQYAQPQYAPGYGPSAGRGSQAPLPIGQVSQQVNYFSPNLPEAYSRYAGFWLRFVAAIIDGFITGIITWIVLIIFTAIFAVGAVAVSQPGSRGSGGDAAAMIAVGYMMVVAALIGINWLYFAGLESSAGQGTFGKRAMDIRVTDEQGRRITFGRATGRFFGKIISGFMMIGCLMAGFTERKQALHDMMAGCLVVCRR